MRFLVFESTPPSQFPVTLEIPLGGYSPREIETILQINFAIWQPKKIC